MMPNDYDRGYSDGVMAYIPKAPFKPSKEKGTSVTFVGLYGYLLSAALMIALAWSGWTIHKQKQKIKELEEKTPAATVERILAAERHMLSELQKTFLS